MATHNGNALPKFTYYADLASELVGGKIIFATDDWFAVAENLIKSSNAGFDPEAFSSYGKVMDGWETRRKRIPGHDWCIIELGCPGIIKGVEVSTHHFTGNFPPRCSLQAACLEYNPPARKGDRIGLAATPEEMEEVSKLSSQDWDELVPMSKLGSGHKETHRNFFEVSSEKRYTHVRLNIYPDGGVARLRIHGEVHPDFTTISPSTELDLAAMVNGGICIGYSCSHYGHAKNVIAPGRARRMDEGWETARRLDRPAIWTEELLQAFGGEWAVYRLGHPGKIHRAEFDTNHFKGNFAGTFLLEGTFLEEEHASMEQLEAASWTLIIARSALSAHKMHSFSNMEPHDKINYVRLRIQPDGGVSRMHLFGTIL